MLNERKRLWYALSLQTGLCRWVVYQIIFPPTPALGQWVKKYIQSCTTCTHSKAMRHRPYRLLKQLPVPPHPWESISMDFIEQLPPSDCHGTPHPHAPQPSLIISASVHLHSGVTPMHTP